MELDANTIFLVAVACIALCGIGVLLFFGLQIIGTSIGVFAGIFELVTQVISGGPVSWCGCLVLFLGCSFCAVITISVVGIIQSCGTPDAVNFCRILGY
jgi:hypothetical protein